MRVAPAAVLSLMSGIGCFGPDAREGLPCSRDGDCPPGQDCYGGVCASSPPPDAEPVVDPGRFGAPELVELVCPENPCLSPRDPSLTDDLTQLSFAVQTLNAPGDHDVYIAVRSTPQDQFQMANPAGMINSLEIEDGTTLSKDGLTLWFSRSNQSVGGPPYSDLWVSTRAGMFDPFDGAESLRGVVNTSFGNERGVAVAEDKTRLLFGRALDLELPDHDLYLAEAGGGQWDTVERLDRLSLAGADERSVALVEQERTMFVSRDDRILEAHWEGDDLAGAQVVSEHDELVVEGMERIVGVWASRDGSEIWFGACHEACALYRASR